MYTVINFATKKKMKEAVKTAGTTTLQGGVLPPVRIYQPGPFARPSDSYTGDFSIEGPHYPKPHRWYARVRVVAGVIVKVLS